MNKLSKFAAIGLVGMLLAACGTKHVHVPGESWSSDADNHWHACECGEKLDVAGHDWDAGVVTTAATCGTDGVKTYTCTTCGATKTEAIDATGDHTYDLGYYVVTLTGHSFICDVCGDVSEEEEHSINTSGYCDDCLHSEGWTGISVPYYPSDWVKETSTALGLGAYELPACPFECNYVGKCDGTVFQVKALIEDDTMGDEYYKLEEDYAKCFDTEKWILDLNYYDSYGFTFYSLDRKCTVNFWYYNGKLVVEVLENKTAGELFTEFCQANGYVPGVTFPTPAGCEDLRPIYFEIMGCIWVSFENDWGDVDAETGHYTVEDAWAAQLEELGFVIDWSSYEDGDGAWATIESDESFTINFWVSDIEFDIIMGLA